MSRQKIQYIEIKYVIQHYIVGNKRSKSMYEVNLYGKNRERFKAAVKKKMEEQRISYKELAEKINRPVNSIYCFMNDDRRPNRFLAAEIAEALDIKQRDWRC